MTDTAMIAAAYPSPPNHSSPPHKPSLGSLYDRIPMSSSMSPDQYGQQPPSGSAYTPGSADKSPLSSLNLNFLKTLSEKRSTRGKTPANCLRLGLQS